MIDLNELEIEFTEVNVSQEEYERRQVALITALLALDEGLSQEEVTPLQEAA